MDGQFYGEELTPVRTTKHTTYKMDNILDKMVRRGILEVVILQTSSRASWHPV
jgi:hypothetical protein